MLAHSMSAAKNRRRLKPYYALFGGFILSQWEPYLTAAVRGLWMKWPPLLLPELDRMGDSPLLEADVVL